MASDRQLLIDIFNAAIEAVSGEQAVIKACQSLAIADNTPDVIIAVGKAASSMAMGALAVFGPVKAVVITKYGHGDPLLMANSLVSLIEAGHPIPDENSLKAGKILFETVAAMAENSRLLMLVSGGASALAELLPDKFTLARWQALTDEMISTGLTIAQINQRRKQSSLIKDGRLLAHFSGAEVVTLAISDVQGDDLSVIGSGLGDVARLSDKPIKAKTALIATNQIARHQAQNAAHEAGFDVVVNEESLYGDVFALSTHIGQRLRTGDRGVYIFGGEPTIVLPSNPGCGGRNQSLALALAKEIAGLDNITILVAGTDGTDGPGNAAGGIVDGCTFAKGAFKGLNPQLALERADAGRYLTQVEDIFITGPTGTNVMDLLIAVVW
ncbi:MAG: glycerate 2-kinase [Phenylobacterium sp.]|jgi:glycerate 2-kinase